MGHWTSQQLTLRAPELPLVFVLGLGMRLIVLGPEMLETDVGVFLRGRKACMTQELLNRPKIRASLQQMGRKTVTKCVGGKPATRRQQPPGSLDKPLDIAGVQPMAADADEERTTLGFSVNDSGVISHGKVFIQCPRRVLAERN